MYIFPPPEVPNCIVLAGKKSILSVQLDGLDISTVNLPENKDPGDADDEDDSKGKPGEGRSIQNCATSLKGFLALATNDKSLLLFNVIRWHPLDANLVAERKIPRVSSAIRFAPNGNQLLVADKSGDCTMYDCTKEDLPEKHLGGHLSIVTDILLTEDEKFFISCDRDEKIRVTNYPGCHEIESYCLGHREFVAQVEFLPHDPLQLVSLSGDSTLRFWNFSQGKEVYKIDLPGAGIRMACKLHETSSSLFTIYISETDSLMVLKVSGAPEIRHEVLKTIPVEDFFVCSIAFSSTHLLAFGVAQVDKNPAKIVGFGLNDWNPVDFSQLNEALQDRLGSFRDVNPGESVAGMFKKKYSNIEEYHERKRKRLEAKEGKQ
uniref:tRNA (guanine-N(7)-)-methyltransferase non-catalytic subunit wuho n=1 Tax=Lutzomyia longipalpis TaxID=7200 RepID=A0A1B0CQJ8_LUTLO